MNEFANFHCSETSEKYKKAKEWGIICINARWLSDIMTGEFAPSFV